MFYHGPSSITHVCTSGQLSGSGHRRRSPAGSVGSGGPPCAVGISDNVQWCDHKFPTRWSPRCHCSRISHTVQPPRLVPGGHHSNHLHTSDSASLHKGKGERSGQELDGWLSWNTVGGYPCVTWVCLIIQLQTHIRFAWIAGVIVERAATVKPVFSVTAACTQGQPSPYEVL